MKKTKLFLIIILFIATSCKEKNDKGVVTKEEFFTVEMNILVNHDDVICLYYKDKSISYFSEEMVIYKNLIKSRNFQNIIFRLPKGLLPNDFRLDLSHENPAQKMTIHKIIFKNKDKEFEILNKDIDKYFTANEGIIYDDLEKNFTFKKNKDGSYDPFLKTTGQFYPLLETVVGSKAFIAHN